MQIYVHHTKTNAAGYVQSAKSTYTDKAYVDTARHSVNHFQWPHGLDDHSGFDLQRRVSLQFSWPE